MEDSAQTASDFETKDLAIPFIRILQSNSPQVNKRGDGYVEGCEPSHIFNTALERSYDGETGIYAIVCKYQRQYTEWKPRIDDGQGGGSGGGFGASATFGKVGIGFGGSKTGVTRGTVSQRCGQTAHRSAFVKRTSGCLHRQTVSGVFSR